MTLNDQPRIKLCGLRGTDDARAAVAAGADLVGIVLVPGTRRYVPPPTARAMVAAIRATAAQRGRFTPEIVGVVGQMSLAVAAQLRATIGVDTIQLVGDDADCERLADAIGDTPIIRTISVSEEPDMDAIRARIARWRERGARIMLDAAIDGELGGTGHRIDVDVVRALLADGRFGLAGGLDPTNVGDVVRELQPAVVDVSSGIESHAGHKDPELMQAFVAAVRAARLDELPADLLAPTDTPARSDAGTIRKD